MMRKIIILFLVLSGLVFAQEKIKDDKEKEFKLKEKEMLLTEKTIIESKLEEISSSPVGFVEKRKTELQNWIDQLPDRKPTREGRITMKEYLKKLKKQVEDNPGDYITQETQRLINQKSQIEAKITETDDNTAIETDIKEKKEEIKDVQETM